MQDKLITYPDAISTALSRDVNRYVNASASPADFVRRALSGEEIDGPLWVGFVENFQAVSEAVGADVKGFLVLIAVS